MLIGVNKLSVRHCPTRITFVGFLEFQYWFYFSLPLRVPSSIQVDRNTKGLGQDIFAVPCWDDNIIQQMSVLRLAMLPCDVVFVLWWSGTIVTTRLCFRHFVRWSITYITHVCPLYAYFNHPCSMPWWGLHLFSTWHWSRQKDEHASLWIVDGLFSRSE